MQGCGGDHQKEVGKVVPMALLSVAGIKRHLSEVTQRSEVTDLSSSCFLASQEMRDRQVYAPRVPHHGQAARLATPTSHPSKHASVLFASARKASHMTPTPLSHRGGGRMVSLSGRGGGIAPSGGVSRQGPPRGPPPRDVLVDE